MNADVKPEMSSLFMDFARYFDLSIATTEAQRADVYHVRYNVYCEEFGYEDAETFKDRMERDSFDAHSIHCLVVHRASKTPAGCVRLVTPGPGELMPMEEHCRDTLDRDFFDPFAARRCEIAEISRLAVDGRFRRRAGEKATRFGNTDTLHFAAREQRTFSLIAVSLFLAASAVADLMQRKDCFAIMEPFLPAILRRTGLFVKRVGGDFEYKGTRAPYYLQIDEAVRAAPDELRLCFEVVRAAFAEAMTPAMLERSA
jgi:N-acyl amino acid synthase of PEP-CTERM/exosortase system